MAEQVDAMPTARGRAKAERRDALLSSAAQLFAGRGFDGVSIEDLGSSVGVSGPAVYRHFPSKQAVLAALLVGVSEGLLAGGRAVVASAADDASALAALVRFHVDFALRDPDVIRVQDRDLAALVPAGPRVGPRPAASLRRPVGRRARPARARRPTAPSCRLRAQATFGLLNSTPHSARAVSPTRTRALLEEMALAALGGPATKP